MLNGINGEKAPLSPAVFPVEVGFWDLVQFNLSPRSMRIVILKGKSFFSRDNGAFSPLIPLRIDFS